MSAAPGDQGFVTGGGDIHVTVNGADFSDIGGPVSCALGRFFNAGLVMTQDIKNGLAGSFAVNTDKQGHAELVAIHGEDGVAYELATVYQSDGIGVGQASVTLNGKALRVEGTIQDVSNDKKSGPVVPFTIDATGP